ncbi:MAG TPA: Cys-Gln thioester bond-forming surface protein [Phycisphaerales bacterium]|nr:Cys-Gln thioester bond-forming surface protein [Phycisphaerales bacterium]
MKTAATLATITVLALAGTSLADTVNARFTGVSPGQSVTMRLDGHNINTQAGAYNFLRSASNPGTLAGFAPTFQGFCIDLTEYVQVGHTYQWHTVALGNAPTSDAGPMGAANALRLGRLFANQYTGLATASNQAQAHAAFQIAVWEIVFDDGLDLAHGSLKATNAPAGTIALAQSWLNTLGSGAGWNLIAIDDQPGCDDGHQGYVLTPAPGAAALMGLGGLAGMRRKRQ